MSAQASSASAHIIASLSSAEVDARRFVARLLTERVLANWPGPAAARVVSTRLQWIRHFAILHRRDTDRAKASDRGGGPTYGGRPAAPRADCGRAGALQCLRRTLRAPILRRHASRSSRPHAHRPRRRHRRSASPRTCSWGGSPALDGCRPLRHRAGRQDLPAAALHAGDPAHRLGAGARRRRARRPAAPRAAIGLKTLAYTVVVSTIAVLIGVALVNLFQPGDGLSPEHPARGSRRQALGGAAPPRAGSGATGVDFLVALVPQQHRQGDGRRRHARGDGVRAVPRHRPRR